MAAGTGDVGMVVDLGNSDDGLALVRDETGGWWADPETPFHSGDSRTPAYGSVHSLTLGGGARIDTYPPGNDHEPRHTA